MQLEPQLRYKLSPKSARRQSFKWLKRARNKAIRNFLKNHPDRGGEIIKKYHGYEY